jgi:mannose-6-phosphate isomerase
VLVCIDGAGEVEHGSAAHVLGKGEAMLLPAVVGECLCRPQGNVRLIEMAIPEGGLPT